MSDPHAAHGLGRQDHLLIVGVLMFCLWASFTNVVPMSVCFVLLVPLIPYAALRGRALPSSASGLVLLYAYLALSTLLYAPASFVEPEFYRRDGNFFVTFLPVLIGASFAVPVDLERVIRSFLKWVTLVNVIFLGVYFATGTTLVIDDPGTYHLLFIAHNAAGGYLGTVCALAIGMYWFRRSSMTSLLIMLINVGALLLTHSRGSVLGLAMGIFVVIVLRERFTRTVLVLTALAIAGAMFYAYPSWVAAGRPIEIYDADPGGASGITDRDANVIDRVMFLWPRAVDLFLQSPLLGTGYGSYNDVPYHLAGYPGFFAYNVPDKLVFSAAHAHNTYLHVLAENGLVGLVLLLVMLRQMWLRIEESRAPGVRLALKLALWVAIFSSLTEHRLFTPSEMLPFTLLYGMLLSAKNWNERHASTISGAGRAPSAALP